MFIASRVRSLSIGVSGGRRRRCSSLLGHESCSRFVLDSGPSSAVNQIPREESSVITDGTRRGCDMVALEFEAPGWLKAARTPLRNARLETNRS
jgi:hypothetical protein